MCQRRRNRVRAGRPLVDTGCQRPRALIVSAPTKPRGGRDGQEGNLRGDRRGRRFGGGADRLLRRRRFAERHFTGRVRLRSRDPPHAQALRPGGHPDQLVHPRPLDRDLPQGDEGGRGGGARDRAARLHPREPDLDDARAGGGRPRQDPGPRHQARGQGTHRLCRAVVGDERLHAPPPDESAASSTTTARCTTTSSPTGCGSTRSGR